LIFTLSKGEENMTDKIRPADLKNFFFTDDRGWVVRPIEAAGFAGKTPGAFHMASLKPGAVRGNHCHPGAAEWVLFIGGPAKLVLKHPANDTVSEITVEGKEPALFEIPAGFGHAIRNISPGDIYLLVFYDVSELVTVKAEVL
jgi:UDP-2-acetamido-2,6-beta-L-arabino-hexul-4-ose reductase